MKYLKFQYIDEETKDKDIKYNVDFYITKDAICYIYNKICSGNILLKPVYHYDIIVSKDPQCKKIIEQLDPVDLLELLLRRENEI